MYAYLRADNVHTTSALESLQQSTTQLQADLSRCNEQLTQKTDELAAKSHDLTEKTRELDKSKSEYDKAVQYSAEEKIELALESVRRITALEEQVKAQKKTAKDMKEMLENAENDMLELKESKQSVAAQLRARCDGLERGLDIMTSESSSASQEMSQLRKKMQESYVLAQREKNELTDQVCSSIFLSVCLSVYVYATYLSIQTHRCAHTLTQTPPCELTHQVGDLMGGCRCVDLGV